MGLYDNIQDAERTNRLPPLTPGFYPKLQILQVEEFHGVPQKGSKIYHKTTFLVLESGPGLSPVGVQCTNMIRLNGKNPVAGLAETSEFTAAALGINPKDKERRKREITPLVVQGSIGTPTKVSPLVGGIVAAQCSRGAPSPEAPDGYPKMDFQPVLDASGRPMFQALPPGLVIQGGNAPAAGSAPQATQAPTSQYAPAFGNGGAYQAPQAAPVPASAPQAAPAVVDPASRGWLPHNGQWYKPGMATCLTTEQVQAEIAAGR